MYAKLSEEELKQIIPDIRETVAVAAPSGAMFANNVRLSGLKMMADHMLEEGIDANVDYIIGQPGWGSEKRTAVALRELVRYGAHAQRVIPRLEAAAKQFEEEAAKRRGKKPSQKVIDIRKAIEDIKASTKKPELKSFK